VTLGIADIAILTVLVTPAPRHADHDPVSAVLTDEASPAVIVDLAFSFWLLAWPAVAFGQTPLSFGAVTVELADLRADALVGAKLVGSASLFARGVFYLPTVAGVWIAGIAPGVITIDRAALPPVIIRASP
jgi:hypothetical protein